MTENILIYFGIALSLLCVLILVAVLIVALAMYNGAEIHMGFFHDNEDYDDIQNDDS